MGDFSPQERALVEEIAEQAANKAVRTCLTSLGIDHRKPLEAQRDFAALHDLREMVADEEWRRDQLHLRKWRRTMDNVQAKGLMTLTGIVVVAIAAALTAGISEMLKRGGS